MGHSHSAEWSQGEETHWHECGNCGDRKDENAHDYGNGDICVECGYERSHVHRLTLVIAVDPTCTEAGHTAYYTCSGCAEWFADASGAVVITDKTTVVIDALGHSFTNYVSDGNATCTEDGTKTAKCDRCDVTDTVTDTGSALGHSFTNYVSDGNATCTEDGTKTAKCDRCDATDTVTDTGSALGHSFTNYVSDGNATCTEDGTKTAKCDRCEVTDTIADPDSALGHMDVDANEHCDVCGAKMDNSSVTPPTGDSSLMEIIFLLMLVCVSGLFVLVVLGKKHSSDQ